MRKLLFSFEGANLQCGEYSREDTPVPISNTVVKLSCADGTWWDTAWESRSSPLRTKHTVAIQCVFLLSGLVFWLLFEFSFQLYFDMIYYM